MEEDPIQVHCRVKPSPSSASFLRVDHSNGMVWADPSHSCRFHHVFGPEASQRHVFEQTALPLLESVCKGFNATLLAYGQTGSGKTHTICGELVGDNQGIIPRVAQYLLEQLDQGKLDQVQFSVLEVYLGELYDLSSRTQNVSKLTIRERSNGDTFVQNLRTFNLVDFDDFVKRFQTASEIRKVAATRQNDRSTRSHLIATFRVQAGLLRSLQGVNNQGVRFDSLFNLGDLSGSERVSKSGVEGKEFEQAVNINLDLHSLRTVVLRIKEKGFPSFRENSLTRLLQNSIEGNCKTRIIFAVRTEPESLNDTIGTIQFALDCSFLKNKVSVSRVKTIESLERQLADQAQIVADLKIENAKLKMENGQLKRELEARSKTTQVTGTETEMVLEEEEEEEEHPLPVERKVVTLATVDQWTQPAVKPQAKPRPTIDTAPRNPPPSPANGLELVAQRIRRKQETSKSLPADLSVFASVANTQTQLNLQVVRLENELMMAKQQVERLTALLNQQQRK